jgi:carboxymethylenebutenolidase
VCHETWRPAGDAATEPPERSFASSDGTPMTGWQYAGENPKGVVLVLPDIYGPSPFYHQVTQMLANDGYEAVMVDYFFREGPLTDRSREAAFARRSGMDENLCLRDISAVIDVLASGYPGRRVGVVGFCLSGTFGWGLTTLRDDLSTVAFYGFPEGPGGQVAGAVPKPIEVASQFQGPILSFWGDQDNIPLELIERFGAEVNRHAIDYQQHVYAGAGHGFLQGLVEDRDDSESAHDAWKRTREFLSSTVAA